MNKNRKPLDLRHKKIFVSRRSFVSFLMLVPIISTGFFKRKIYESEETNTYVMIDGWMLKKKDLHAV